MKPQPAAKFISTKHKVKQPDTLKFNPDFPVSQAQEPKKKKATVFFKRRTRFIILSANHLLPTRCSSHFLFACPQLLNPPFTPCWKFSTIPVIQPSMTLSIHLFITFYYLHRVLESIRRHGQDAASLDSLPELSKGRHPFQYVFKYSVSHSM